MPPMQLATMQGAIEQEEPSGGIHEGSEVGIGYVRWSNSSIQKAMDLFDLGLLGMRLCRSWYHWITLI
jgi:hypothetical protein